MPKLRCSECGYPKPTARLPGSFRQALWGGWTCPNCANAFDAFGSLVTPKSESYASNPAVITISARKLRVLRPDLYGFAGVCHRLHVKVGLAWDQLKYIKGHLIVDDQ